MFTVCVRDHLMIAHSFRGEVFGPARRLHGATYVVDVELKRPSLDADGVVVDIGRATQALRQVLADLDYRNLDEVSVFSGQNTTTEFLAKEETGLSAERSQALRISERCALASARHVVVTSGYTVGLVAGLGVERERISVVEPGTDPAPRARGSVGSTLNLLCVASLTHRKGHVVLLDALARLKDRDWQLTCVGSLRHSPATVAELRERIAVLDLQGRVTLSGEVTDAALAGFYDSADLFVLATYFEGYGMALAEALARGLPVVSTRTGAVTATVPKGAGFLVPPNDPEALATALADVMDDPRLRQRLSEGAGAARSRLPSWDAAARRMAGILRGAGACS